jgi:hypothetical protein
LLGNDFTDVADNARRFWRSNHSPDRRYPLLCVGTHSDRLADPAREIALDLVVLAAKDLRNSI